MVPLRPRVRSHRAALPAAPSSLFSYPFSQFDNECFMIRCAPLRTPLSHRNPPAFEHHPAPGVAIRKTHGIEVFEYRPHGATAAQPAVKSSHVTPSEGSVTLDQPPSPIRRLLPVLFGLFAPLDHFIPLLFERQVEYFHIPRFFVSSFPRRPQLRRSSGPTSSGTGRALRPCPRRRRGCSPDSTPHIHPTSAGPW